VDELCRLVDACLLPGFDATGPPLPAWLGRALQRGLAGVVLYGHNLTTPAGPGALTAALRAERPDLLVALDEEGGDVTRLEMAHGSSYPGNLALGTVDDQALTRRVAAAIGRDLAAAGVNLDLAPVVDVNCDPDNPVIGVRSFGADPGLVAAHGTAFVAGLQGAGVAACAKHFPGHGDTRSDSHHTLPVVTATAELLRARELVPFRAAVRAGVRAVMTAHVRFPALDALPATLSPTILDGLLRRELGFDGVVVTDALDMGAVTGSWSMGEAAVRSLAAGADALCLGPAGGEAAVEAIRRAVAAAVRDGTLPPARLEQAAARVRDLAAWAAPAATGTAGPAWPPGDPPGARAGPHPGLEAARRALRVEGDLPLGGPPAVVELHAEPNLAVGATRWGLAAALAELGPVARVLRLDAAPAHPGELDDLVAGLGSAPLVVAVRDAYRSPWQRAWLRRLADQRPDAVTVAVGMPDDLALVPGPALATHGAARVCTDAAAEALAGRGAGSPA
jgi:beta-N-acetylhexosaminidase